jgi:hypothetical protein
MMGSKSAGLLRGASSSFWVDPLSVVLDTADLLGGFHSMGSSEDQTC